MIDIYPDMTVAEVLDINPFAARVLYQYGIRNVFRQDIANQTLRDLCKRSSIYLPALLEDLAMLPALGSWPISV